jgi:hypothetical protein
MSIDEKPFLLSSEPLLQERGGGENRLDKKDKQFFKRVNVKK